jgi:hypothetical protein
MKISFMLVMLVAGCAAGSTAARDGQAQAEAERRALESCRTYLCPARVEVTMQNACVADREERYARLPDATAKRNFLLQGGCPATLVDGSAGVAQPGR